MNIIILEKIEKKADILRPLTDLGGYPGRVNRFWVAVLLHLSLSDELHTGCPYWKRPYRV